MINIFYSKIDFSTFLNSFEDKMSGIPDEMKYHCLRYKHVEDRCRNLAGKLLVKKAFETCTHETDILKNIKLNERYNRPYLPGTVYDFNISHSGNYVACIIGKNANVGIDIEMVREIDIDCFKPYLSEKEWENVNTSAEKCLDFYRVWTKKESIIKADGRGLSVLNDIHFQDGNYVLGTVAWKVKEIFIDEEYVSHFAYSSSDCNVPVAGIEI